MDNEEIEGSDDNEFGSAQGRGRKYTPVVAHDNDRAVVEMSSLDPGSSSSPFSDHSNLVKKIRVGMQSDVDMDSKEGQLPTHGGVNGPQRESKLELFDFDSLVNILARS